ncbi:MAG TPA: flagellar hook capping protein [Lachnospiraceae bacterium]|nr:flagellar hook capping protein [Lachnospiraceae bacterium]
MASVSGTNNAYNYTEYSPSASASPYDYQSYTVESNDKNTLTMTDYFQLLATQLQNQDMSNPMETSEMMSSLMQMGMISSMESMTNAVNTSTSVSTQTYAASLMGQEVTVIVTEEIGGQQVATNVKYAKVEYVSFVNGVPHLKVEGDDKEYLLSDLVGVGRIPNPFEKDIEVDDKDKEEDNTDESDKVDDVENGGEEEEGTPKAGRED